MYPGPLACNRPPVVHREPFVHLSYDHFGLELEVCPDNVAEGLRWILQVADHLQLVSSSREKESQKRTAV